MRVPNIYIFLSIADAKKKKNIVNNLNTQITFLHL